MNVSDVVETYRSRPATWDDIPAIVDLANVVVIDQWGEPDWTIEEIEGEFAQPGYVIEEFVRLWHNAQGTLVGVCMVSGLQEPPVRVNVTPFVHPALSDYQALGLEVLAWGEAVARSLAIPRCPEHAKVQMLVWTYALHEPTIALYHAYGMEKIRQFWTMEIDLGADLPPLSLPEGVTIRTFRYPEETHLAYRINDQAFSDHYGHTDDPEMKNYDRWAHRKFNTTAFDPTLWFMVEVEGAVAGFAWCRAGMNEDPQLGWVDTLGVLPAFRRQGLATFLLQHAFRELYARGMHKAGLGVDATSITGATRVYERAGMHIFRQFNRYAKVLRDGVEIARE